MRSAARLKVVISVRAFTVKMPWVTESMISE